MSAFYLVLDLTEKTVSITVNGEILTMGVWFFLNKWPLLYLKNASIPNQLLNFNPSKNFR